jgi:anaerobic glycerol-3-phosphate dehydrogenase
MEAIDAYDTLPEAMCLARHLSDGPLDVSTIEPELARFERLAEIHEEVRAAAIERVLLSETLTGLMDERRELIAEIAASAGVEERVLLGQR